MSVEDHNYDESHEEVENEEFESETIQNEPVEDEPLRVETAPIQDLINFRKKQQETAKKKHELKILKAEREELETYANIRKEKLKIAQLKKDLEKPELIPENKLVLKQVQHHEDRYLEEVKYFGGRPARMCLEHKRWEFID